jgi:hypothetical protein
MAKSERTFGLFQTEVRALEFLHQKDVATAADVYEASGSRGHPKYVIKKLEDKKLIERTGWKVAGTDSEDMEGWKLTRDAYKFITLASKKIGKLNIC